MELLQYGKRIDNVTWVKINPIINSIAKSGDELSGMMNDDTRVGFFSALAVLAEIVAEIERELDSVGA